MWNGLIADALVVIHGLWLVFVVCGAFLALRWSWVPWLHVPAVAWGAFIEFTGGICPLTPWENHFRRLGGEVGYSGGFIERYVTAAIYPDGLTREIQIVLGIAVLALNVAAYWWVWKRGRTPEAHPG